MLFKNIINFFTFAHYPNQLKYIMWTEAAERYAFYGMRAILVIYISQYLKLANNISSAIFNYFNAFAYLTPLLGAYLADKYLGKFKTIIIFSSFYALGFIILACSTTFWGLIIALFFIGLGTGGIKPCISTFMADQLDANNANYKNLRAKAFSMFYFMINIGSLTSTFVTPITREIFGSHIAFSIPAFLMILSLIIFLLGKKYYVHIDTTKQNYPPFFKIIISAFRNFRFRNKKDILLSGALRQYNKKDVYLTYNLLQIIKIFSFMIVFYAVWDQQGSSWVIQALSMNKDILGFTIPPDIMQVFNPLFILLLVPIVNKTIYPYINKFFVLTPFRKIVMGIIVSSFAFFIIGLLQQLIDKGYSISILWQILAYFLISLAEVLLTITFMEFAYAEAPKNMKSIIMSLFWLTFFLGDLLAAIILQINIFQGATFFYFFSGLAFIIGILFIPISKTYKQKEVE